MKKTKMKTDTPTLIENCYRLYFDSSSKLHHFYTQPQNIEIPKRRRKKTHQRSKKNEQIYDHLKTLKYFSRKINNLKKNWKRGRKERKKERKTDVVKKKNSKKGFSFFFCQYFILFFWFGSSVYSVSVASSHTNTSSSSSSSLKKKKKKRKKIKMHIQKKLKIKIKKRNKKRSILRKLRESFPSNFCYSGFSARPLNRQELNFNTKS